MNNTLRMFAGIALAACLGVTAAVAQDKKAPEKAPDKAAAKAPIRAQKVLEDNDRVRVTEGVFKPGEVNPLEKRNYRVTRVLKGSTTVERTIDGKTEKLEYKEGMVIVSPAGMSMLKNIGKGEITIYTVTLK